MLKTLFAKLAGQWPNALLFFRGIAMVSWFWAGHLFVHGQLQHAVGIWMSCVGLSAFGLLLDVARIPGLFRTEYSLGSRLWIVVPAILGSALSAYAAYLGLIAHNFLLTAIPLSGIICWADIYWLYCKNGRRFITDWNGQMTKSPRGEKAWNNPPSAATNMDLTPALVAELEDAQVDLKQRIADRQQQSGLLLQQDKAEQLELYMDRMLSAVVQSVLDGTVQWGTFAVYLSGHPVARKKEPVGHGEGKILGLDGRWKTVSSYFECGVVIHDLEGAKGKELDWNNGGERFFVYVTAKSLSVLEVLEATRIAERMWARNKEWRRVHNGRIRFVIRLLPIAKAWKKKLVKKVRYTGYDFPGLLRGNDSPNPWRFICVATMVHIMQCLKINVRQYTVEFFGFKTGVFVPPIVPWELMDDPGLRLLDQQDRREYEAKHGVTLLDDPALEARNRIVADEQAKRAKTLLGRVQQALSGFFQALRELPGKICGLSTPKNK